MVDEDEEIESDKAPIVTIMNSIAHIVVDNVKEKRKKKNAPPKSSMKDTEIGKEKTPKEKSRKKKRKVEGKVVERKSLKRKLVQISDSKIYVEEGVMDMLSIVRIKVGGKRIYVNVLATPMDNVSFHSKTSVHKWKYLFKRMIGPKRDLGKEDLEYK